MSFALRGASAAAWAAEFHLSNEQLGWINGTAFWGFTVAMMFGGPLCTLLGLGRIVIIAFVGHAIGLLLTTCAWNYGSLYLGTLSVGIANGAVEAACNPLIATLFPEEKTTKLNHFHVWFPGGIVIGGVLAYVMERAAISWRMQFATALFPLVAYGALFARQSFPRPQRTPADVSSSTQARACLNPLFIVMVLCMLLTAATELGPGQWIPNILSNAGMPGILVLVWINGLMAAGRQGAGLLAHRLPTAGILVISAVLSCIGLVAMSHATGAWLFGAATVFAFGVCFFWPTMLGNVSERFPGTGPLGLAIMGGAGMLSVSIVLPVMGRLFDAGIVERMPGGHTATELAAATDTGLATLWTKIQAEAGLATLGKVAVLPLVLALVFSALWLGGRRQST
jgi:fucose permease